MRPPTVYANPVCPAGCPCDLLSLLHGPHRLALRLVMILLSHHGLPAATIAALLGCDPATVRRWIHRYNTHGTTGLGDQPRAGRPRRGSPRLGQRIRRLLDQPKAWTIGRLWSTLGRPATANVRCAAGSARWPAGGGPDWSPRATPPATRSWPSCTSGSGTCPPVRWCWPRTRPTSTCCRGYAPPGSSAGGASTL